MPTTLYLQASGHPSLKLCNPLLPCVSAYNPALMDWFTSPNYIPDELDDDADTLVDPWVDDVGAYPSPPPEVEPPPPVGGGAIIRTYETRRRLSEELETALAAMRRQPTRSKRKKALASATGALQDLVESMRAMPSSAVPTAARDLAILVTRGIEVETGVITFADWRLMVSERIAQAQAELEAMGLMIEEEEAAMFMLMAA